MTDDLWLHYHYTSPLGPQSLALPIYDGDVPATVERITGILDTWNVTVDGVWWCEPRSAQ